MRIQGILEPPTLALAMVLALAIIVGPTGATTLTPNPALDFEGQGLAVAIGGTGMRGGSGTFTVDIGGPVVTAVLYWGGRDFYCAPAGAVDCVPPAGYDDTMLFEGNVIPADRLIGDEVGCCAQDTTNNIGYAADVTAIVSAKGTGAQSFAVVDGDPLNLSKLVGAGLLVVYVDPADTDLQRVIVYEGLDFAYRGSSPPPATVTEPVTFTFDAVDSNRDVEVTVFAGDTNAGRPDRVAIDADSILNNLDADEGRLFDADTFPGTIPAGATSMTLQLFSETNVFLETNPDSLMWFVGALRMPLGDEEEEATGRMTGGRNVRVNGAHVRGVTGGMTIHCDITLSNNIQVSWPGNKWHLDKPITAAVCIDDPNIDPTPPAAPFDTFIGEGIGKLNGVDGSAIRFTFIDAGEPGSDDSVEILIWAPGDDPNSDSPYFSVSGKLDGGNIQAHFDQPHQ